MSSFSSSANRCWAWRTILATWIRGVIGSNGTHNNCWGMYPYATFVNVVFRCKLEKADVQVTAPCCIVVERVCCSWSYQDSWSLISWQPLVRENMTQLKVHVTHRRLSSMCAVSWALKALSPTAWIMARHGESLSSCRQLTLYSEIAATLQKWGSPLAAYFAMYCVHTWMSMMIWRPTFTLQCCSRSCLWEFTYGSCYAVWSVCLGLCRGLASQKTRWIDSACMGRGELYRQVGGCSLRTQ